MVPEPGPRDGTAVLPAAVDVCVCTYRRAGVADTLRSLGEQVLPAGTAIRVIVADNDVSPSARGQVEAAAVEAGLDFTYVHAPARNISVARNACLAAGTAPLLAFIDDDEVASPGWLAALLAEAGRSRAAIVLGPVVARYRPDAPRWAVVADLHSTRPAIRRDGAIDTGYSCNVLMERAVLNGLRFDVALGRSGGEDDMFFSRLHRAGARVAYAPGAVVFEDVPPARARLAWLLRRSFRNGQTFAAIRQADGAAWLPLVASFAAKLLSYAIVALVGLPFSARWRAALVRGALHAGALGRMLGKRDLQIY